MTINIPDDQRRHATANEHAHTPGNIFARCSAKLHDLLEWICDQWNTSALKQGLSRLWDAITSRFSKKQPTGPSNEQTEQASSNPSKDKTEQSSSAPNKDKTEQASSTQSKDATTKIPSSEQNIHITPDIPLTEHAVRVVAENQEWAAAHKRKQLAVDSMLAHALNEDKTASAIMRWNPFEHYMNSAIHKQWDEAPYTTMPYETNIELFRDPNMLMQEVIDLGNEAIQNIATLIEQADNVLERLSMAEEQPQLHQLFEKLKTSSPSIAWNSRHPDQPMCLHSWKELDEFLKCTNKLAIQVRNKDAKDGLFFYKLHAALTILGPIIREAKTNTFYCEKLKEKLEERKTQEKAFLAINTSNTQSNESCIPVILATTLPKNTEINFLVLAKCITIVFIENFTEDMRLILGTPAHDKFQVETRILEQVDSELERAPSSYGIDPYRHMGESGLRKLINIMKKDNLYPDAPELLENQEERACVSSIVSQLTSSNEITGLEQTKPALYELINKMHQRAAPDTEIHIQDVQNQIISYFDSLTDAHTNKTNYTDAEKKEPNSNTIELIASFKRVRNKLLNYINHNEYISLIASSPFVHKQSS